MSTSPTTLTWLDRPDLTAVIFHPRRAPHQIDPPANGTVLDIPTDDGHTLGARFHSAGPARPTILFFHGNGELALEYDPIAAEYVRRGINFLVVDYRGYGRSTGTPTASTMLADTHTVHAFTTDWLRQKGYDGRRIVMGRSLGSAPALELAATSGADFDGLIIESGFAHMIPLLHRLGGRVTTADATEAPVLKQLEKIALYAGPTLIIHGDQDQVIPYADAQALHDASRSPTKRLLTIRGGDHNTLLMLGFQEYMDAVLELTSGASKKE